MHICHWSGESKLECNFNSHENCVFYTNFWQFIRFVNCVGFFFMKNCNKHDNNATYPWAEFEFLDFFMLLATMTQPFSIFSVGYIFFHNRFQIQFTFFFIKLLKFGFVVVFWPNRGAPACARTRRSSGDISLVEKV